METLPKEATMRELYGPAMDITDQAEADDYLDALVRRSVDHFGQAREEAERMQRANLGYFAGYCDGATMERVNRLFKTTHPVFGGTMPSCEEAFEMGKKAGEAAANVP